MGSTSYLSGVDYVLMRKIENKEKRKD